MNPLQRINKWFGAKQKAISYPTISGGFDIFRDFIGGSRTMSQTRALQTYEKSLYVFACVKKIAQKTASVNFELYKIKNTDGDKEEVFAHEALDLLYRPNPFQTKTEFFERYMINKLLAGESFVLKVRENGPTSRIAELWNLRPDRVRILIDKNDPNLIKGYEFTRDDGVTLFERDDIIHDAYPSPLDDFGGVSALQPSRLRIDTEEFASTYQANFFKNNARPDFILSTDTKVDSRQKDEIKGSWDKRHKGSSNSGKGAFLEGGLKYQQVSITQREMDYIESMKFTRDDILVAFQVPKPIVAITEDVNLANAETAMEIFLRETIEPEVSRLVEKLNEHLVYDAYGDNFYIDYSRDFLPNDDKLEAEVDQLLISSGIMLINEAREKRGMEAIEGGDSLYLPMNMVPVGGRKPTKKELASRVQKELDKKRAVFRGRGEAHKFIELSTRVEREIYKELGVHLIEEKKETEAKVHKYIEPDMRDTYADVVNKAIDAKTSRYKPEVLKFANEQRARVTTELEKQHNKGLSTKALGGLFSTKIENRLFAELSFPFITEFYKTGGKDAMDSVNPARTFDVSASATKIIKNHVKGLAIGINKTTRDSLSKTLGEGLGLGEGIDKLRNRVSDVYDDFPLYRAETIARTEATAANNWGFQDAYEQSGVANSKEWVATEDGHTRTSHMILDGSVVGVHDTFGNGLKYPGDTSGPPDEVINCRCVLAPVYRE